MPNKLLHIASACLILAVTGCSTLDDYQAQKGPYDRERLCNSLSRQLQYYDNEAYHKAHPISEAKLNEIYQKYKANGCDK